MRSTFLISLLLAGSALAADTRWGLRWKAPDDCISPSELSALVEKKLGRAVFGANPDYRIEGVMTGQAASPKWRARVTVVSAQGDVLGSREVVGDGDCRSLDERVAFIVSVSIDEGITEAPKPVVKTEPQPLPPPAASPLPRREPGRVYVEIEADKENVALTRVVGGGYGTAGNTTVYLTTWEKVCTAPCEQLVDKPRSDFFLTGTGMVGHGPFHLDGYDAVKIKVKGGSLGARFAGVLLISMGAAAVITGAVFALVGGLTSNSHPGVQNPYGGTGTVFRDIGIGMLIGGGAALAGGIPLIAFSGTKVEFLPLPTNGVQGRDANVTEL